MTHTEQEAAADAESVPRQPTIVLALPGIDLGAIGALLRAMEVEDRHLRLSMNVAYPVLAQVEADVFGNNESDALPMNLQAAAACVGPGQFAAARIPCEPGAHYVLKGFNRLFVTRSLPHALVAAMLWYNRGGVGPFDWEGVEDPRARLVAFLRARGQELIQKYFGQMVGWAYDEKTLLVPLETLVGTCGTDPQAKLVAAIAEHIGGRIPDDAGRLMAEIMSQQLHRSFIADDEKEKYWSDEASVLFRQFGGDRIQEFYSLASEWRTGDIGTLAGWWHWFNEVLVNVKSDGQIFVREERRGQAFSVGKSILFRWDDNPYVDLLQPPCDDPNEWRGFNNVGDLVSARRLEIGQTKIVHQLQERLYEGDNPANYVQPAFVDDSYPHTFLPEELIDAVLDIEKPSFWLEIGSMIGNSAIRVADAIKKTGRETEVVCIDPFCGDVNFWDREWAKDERQASNWKFMNLQAGRATIYERFLANVSVAGHTDIIIPIQVTSSIGLRLLRRLFDSGRLTTLPQVIYLDSSHEAGETLLELQGCWSTLGKRGILMGDDWSWDAVRRDVTGFAATIKINAGRQLDLLQRLPPSTLEAQGQVIIYKGQWILVK